MNPDLAQVLAAIGLLACLALLVHHALGARRQAAFERAWQRHSARFRLWARGLGQRRRARGQAAREAADLIERAKRGADTKADGAAGKRPAGQGQSGKVVRPPRFGDRRNDLH